MSKIQKALFNTYASLIKTKGRDYRRSRRLQMSQVRETKKEGGGVGGF
jgi:hypothetical protein